MKIIVFTFDCKLSFQADRVENQPRNTSKVQADAKILQEVSLFVLSWSKKVLYFTCIKPKFFKRLE